MITRYKAADPLDPTSQAEYKVLAAGAQRYWHGTRAAFEQVKNSIPNNTMICITDDNDAPSDNAPIGSVFDYEGNTAPDGYLFCDGSTFDTSLYPDLYLFLGSDTLPVRGSQYDYSNAQAIATSAFASGYTAPADGLILIPYFQCTSGVSGFKNIYINGTIVASPYNNSSSSRNVCVQTPVKKGDVVTIDANTGVMSTPSFVPVTKYKLIKATSNMSKSDASALLAQVIQHMTLDYSNIETITALPYTATKRGMLLLNVGQQNGSGSRIFYIDNVEVGSFQTGTNIYCKSTLSFPLDKGQTFTSDGTIWGTYRFVPYK